ncbi:MAG: hypothetical protein ACRDY7_08090, partial [Acidimicrobiia bacterium]
MWQALADELRDTNLQVISVALDMGGKAAVEPWIRPADIPSHCPPPLRAIMGWDDADWVRAGTPAYPCLIDANFELTRLYGIVNVPTAVWIDESGRVVRAPEPAGVMDAFRRLNPETFSIPADDAAAGRELRGRY